MKAASTIIELYKNLSPAKFLTREEEAWYVPIYEDAMDDIRFSVIHSEQMRQVLYVTGQSGTGKTTALNFLSDEEVEKQYQVEYLYGNELLDLGDVDVVDLLLMICYRLITRHRKLEKQFRDELAKMRKQHEGLLKIEKESSRSGTAESGGGIKAKFGLGKFFEFLDLFNLSTEFFTNLRMDATYRKVSREAFAFKKRDLLELTNNIIREYLAQVAPDKPLLLIINELDHIKDPALITELFVNNRQYLEMLECRKIISVPVVLMANDTFTPEIKPLGLKIKFNPLKPGKMQADEDEIESNKAKLREIVSRRIESGAELIQAEALEKAIELSGGILRQFISILHNATQKVARLKGSQVSLQDVLDGAAVFRKNVLERAIISQDKIRVLEEIRTSHSPLTPSMQVLITAILGNQVLVYPNEPAWYDLNPLIEETVKIYARKLPPTS